MSIECVALLVVNDCFERSELAFHLLKEKNIMFKAFQRRKYKRHGKESYVNWKKGLLTPSA